MPSRSTLLLIVILCSNAIPVTRAIAETPEAILALIDQPVIVTLLDGRTPRGRLSAKSNMDWLVLVAELPEMSLESRFAARLIVDVQRLSSDSPPVELPTRLPPAPRPSALMSGEFPMLSPAENSIVPHWSTCDPLPTFPSERILHGDGLDYRQSVRSLLIDSTLGNWDGDAETDGLLVRVQPLDGWGQVVPVDGHLDVELITETRLHTGGQVIRRDAPLRVMERWSVPVHALEYDATGTVVPLTFRRFHPDRDCDIAPRALLKARLRLPSVGAFDAIDPCVILQPIARHQSQ